MRKSPDAPILERITLDSSVVYAGLYSRSGASHRVLELAGVAYTPCLSVPLVLEYESVLMRPALLDIYGAAELGRVIDRLCAVGIHQRLHYLWRPTSRDPDDDMVIETAMQSGSQALLTFNTKDLGVIEEYGITLWKPGDWLRDYRERNEGKIA